MIRESLSIPSLIDVCALVTLVMAGCGGSRSFSRSAELDPISPADALSSERSADIQLAAHRDDEGQHGPLTPATSNVDPADDSSAAWSELATLEAIAASSNPALIRLQQQARSAAAKSRYVNRLPDPTLGANVFGHPIETAAGSQRANLSVMQMIPWLERLDAQQQQVCYEALALQQQYQAERLRVIGDVRTAYYQLYILTRQIETIEANQQLLESLIEIDNARVATGQATQGDVLLGTLELSRLEEQLLTLRQQVRSTQAEINRLLNRPMDTAINVPERLDVETPDWTYDLLVRTAMEYQPLIAAAHLQTSAARWGLEVAQLRHRPDFQVGASWYFIEDNRPSSNVVDVGRDAWSLGGTMTIPLDRQKYTAIRDEAAWKHAAAAANVADVEREFDARLLDLLEQARAAAETAALYRDTIIPQSEQTLRADQDSLTDGTVEFDRVIQDFRNLLTLEFGYHRAVGQLATSLARIRQAVGIDLQP